MANGWTVFVDTDVLLYAVDPRSEGKRAAAVAWLDRCWRDRCGRLSSQVLHELYVNLRRVAPSYDAKAARLLVERYRAWSPWPVDQTTVDLAWRIEDQASVSYWDALMIAAAEQQSCGFLLTEDLQHGQLIGSVRIVNPFVSDPGLLEAAR